MDKMKHCSKVMDGRCKGSFWQVLVSQSICWGWRKLLKLRTLCQQFVEREGAVTSKVSMKQIKYIATVWKVITPKIEKYPSIDFCALPTHSLGML